MALSQQLFTATFNGIPFLVDSATTTAGRKTQTFEYPNQKYRYVEDLGENLKSFSLKAIVTGGDDYLLRREALIIALQRKGSGVLTHPFYGLVFVVVKNYSIDEDMTTLGECRIDISFEETRSNIYPIADNTSIFGVDSLVEETIPFLSGYFASEFSLKFKKNIIDASNKSVDLADKLQPIKPVATDFNVLNDFYQKKESFLTERYILLQNQIDYISYVFSLIDAYNNLSKTTSDAYSFNSNLYYYGNKDVAINATTGGLAERVKNRKVLNGVVNAYILLKLYSIAMNFDYQDNLKIDFFSKDLEEKYRYLLDNSVLAEDILKLLDKIRTTARFYFNNLKVNVSKIIETQVVSTPLTVLNYTYYADFDNEDEIISLNNINNAIKINGSIKLLTETSDE